MFDGIYQLGPDRQPTFAKVRAFAEHCASLSDASGTLRAERFDPSRIHKLAPFLLMIGVARGVNDHNVRLAGTRLVKEFFGGQDPTGQRLSTLLIDDEFGRRSRFIMDEAVRTGAPILNQPGRSRMKAKSYLRLETLTVPLVDRRGEIVKLAAMHDYFFEEETEPA